jgi:hypothetical protein
VSVGVKVVLLVEGDTMGEYLHPYTEFLGSSHAWTHQRRDGLSHYQNLTSLSVSSSIFENFWEPMSIGVKVILLVGGDIVGEYLHPYTKLGTLKVNTNMCTMDKLAKRWTFTSPKIDKPFGARFHFENFWEPMSIGVKVILLAGHDNTLYIPCRVWNS